MVVEPVATPVTVPVEFTVAIPGLALVHVPPPVELESVVVAPGHTVAVPVIVPADGSGFTVNERVVSLAPQPLVTV